MPPHSQSKIIPHWKIKNIQGIRQCQVSTWPEKILDPNLIEWHGMYGLGEFYGSKKFHRTLCNNINLKHNMQTKRRNMAPTLAVFSRDGVAIETWGTPLAFCASGVSPAVLAVARHIVTFVENQIRVWVTIAVTSLAGITDFHRVAIVTRRTPGWGNITVTLKDVVWSSVNDTTT